MKQFSLLSRRVAALFLSPGAVLVGLFVLLPFFWVIFVSFTNRTLLGRTAVDPDFVGLQNYFTLFNPATFFTRGQFGFSLILTIQFVLLSALIGQALLGLLLAWLSQSVTPTLKSFLQTAVIAAWILPEVVIGFAWFAYLDRDAGTLNALLGIPGFAWLLDHPMLSIIIFNTWRGTAFSMMLYGAALGNVPPSHLESARLAGASGWQQLRDVVFPHIRGHILTNLLLISLWTFNDFSPFLLTAGGPDAWESEIRAALNHAEQRARSVGTHLIMTGILPTLRQEDVGEGALSENPRYRLLNDQIFAARGEDLHIEVTGIDRLRTYADTITPEAACTSTQFHLQVSPEQFADYWNAAQAIAGSRSPSPPTPLPRSARNCGTRRASRCSSRPPTPARTFENTRRSARFHWSAVSMLGCLPRRIARPRAMPVLIAHLKMATLVALPALPFSMMRACIFS